jgi:uncharacterized membrane protein
LLKESAVQQAQELVANISINEPVLTAPMYNHPMHWTGQPVVMGYDGHVWSQGVNPEILLKKLDSIYHADDNWQQVVKEVGAKYLFWGEYEQSRYRVLPVELQSLPIVAKNAIGVLYALDPH